jgi:ABC-type sulfate transport system substrate-binding protein
MGIRELYKMLLGSKCEQMVKINGNKITITGVKTGYANISIDVGQFENNYVEFYKVTPTLVAMDKQQYLLCQYSEDLPKDDPTRRDCEKMRLQSMIGFLNLESKLGFKDDERFKDDIEEWMQYMDDLQKIQIEFLSPQISGSNHQTHLRAMAVKMGTPNRDSKTVIHNTSDVDKTRINLELKRIGKYQGIDESELKMALNEVMNE